jgi:hypothetical protein
VKGSSRACHCSHFFPLALSPIYRDIPSCFGFYFTIPHVFGIREGFVEGERVGRVKGVEVGEEIGFYRGCLFVWKALYAENKYFLFYIVCYP